MFNGALKLFASVLLTIGCLWVISLAVRSSSTSSDATVTTASLSPSEPSEVEMEPQKAEAPTPATKPSAATKDTGSSTHHPGLSTKQGRMVLPAGSKSAHRKTPDLVPNGGSPTQTKTVFADIAASRFKKEYQKNVAQSIQLGQTTSELLEKILAHE